MRSSPRLIDAFGDWITAGKIDNSPQDAPYNFASLSTAAVAHWPLKNQEYTSVLFVASMPGDSGRRPGDGALPNPPAVPVPANFWATSPIALTYPPGVPGQTAGAIANPVKLLPHAEYWVVALIGNAGSMQTGSATAQRRQMHRPGRRAVLQHLHQPGHRRCRRSTTSIRRAPTRSTSSSTWACGPTTSWASASTSMRCSPSSRRRWRPLPPAMLGNLPPAEWLREGHPCVKVRIMSGEQLDHYPPAGGAPQPPDPNSVLSLPTVDRHIAQHNLAPFDPNEVGMKKIKWVNFIVAQAGAGWNELVLETALPADAVHFWFAVPRAAYERWIDPRTSKGGAVRGLEATSDPPVQAVPRGGDPARDRRRC